MFEDHHFAFVSLSHLPITIIINVSIIADSVTICVYGLARITWEGVGAITYAIAV